jgi:hypothetical protein
VVLAAHVVDAKIVLCVLIEILDGDPIVAGGRLSRQGDVAFVYLGGGAPNANAGAVAVEDLGALGTSLLALGWPISV